MRVRSRRGLQHRRAGQGNDALGIQPARGEQAADRDHVLIIEMPDLAASADRMQEVDMGADQPGRMGTGKLGSG